MLADVFGVMRRAREQAMAFEETMAKIQKAIGQDAAELALELGRLTTLSQQTAADAVWDCFCAGRTLEQTRALINESVRTRISVRSLIELRTQAYRNTVGARTYGVDMSTNRQVDSR